MNPIPQTNKAYVLIAISLEFAPLSKVLEGTQLTETSLDELDTIDISDAIQVVKNINRYSYTPNWPVILGNHLGIATHGPVGYAAVSAPTIGKALSTFVEWFHIRSECYTSTISEGDESFEIRIGDTSGDEAYKSFFFESFMRAFEVLIGLLLGQPQTGKTHLYFEARAEDRKHLMAAVYDSNLHFGAEHNKLIIPKSIWYQPSPLSDQDSYQLNCRKCQQRLEKIEQKNRLDIAVRNILRHHIDNRIMSNNDAQHLPSLKQVCEALHHSERTLIRKLRQLDTSYKQILETERMFFSDKLLKDARYTVFDIADILGYTESASFCRAFKSWYGQRPSAYRRNPHESKKPSF